MARLIYSATASLDGYTTDAEGGIDWSVPDEEVHGFVNDLVRPVGTFLFGRRMYQIMVVWETWNTADEPAVVRDFSGIWQGADKVVYSRTLETVSSARTRVERDFDVQAIREMKASADRDICIGGAELASQAFAAGLVDDVYVFIAPILLGSGTRNLSAQVRLDLELVNEHRFPGGTVHLHYRQR
jgi:dihydrofolate reductase